MSYAGGGGGRLFEGSGGTPAPLAPILLTNSRFISTEGAILNTEVLRNIGARNAGVGLFCIPRPN
jgi:hypothetical protein